MKIEKQGDHKFEPCPSYKGVAVCVDVTPLKTVETQYGPKEKFRVVFEVGAKKKDGKPFCVWSAPFTPSYNAKSAFYKFMKDWLGRAMTDAELESFDTEQLLGRQADMVVAQEEVGTETYANIRFLGPWAGDVMKPSGTFVRAKDRPAKDEGSKPSYRRAASPQGELPVADDWQDCKVHGGPCTGMKIRELTRPQIEKLLEKWLPAARAKEKQTADDKRLIFALESWAKKNLGVDEAAAMAEAEEADDIPFE
jgi:hypothetical protein